MKLIVILTLFTTLISCAHSRDFKYVKEERILDNLKSFKTGLIFTSGQPTIKDLRKLKDQGFDVVINMRSPKEKDIKHQRAIVESQGLIYRNVIYTGKSKMSDEYLERIYKLTKDKKSLIHCSSANRAGVWLGSYLNKKKKVDKEILYKNLSSIGITKDKASHMLKEYLR